VSEKNGRQQVFAIQDNKLNGIEPFEVVTLSVNKHTISRYELLTIVFKRTYTKLRTADHSFKNDILYFEIRTVDYSFKNNIHRDSNYRLNVYHILLEQGTGVLN
jgi:hypothetical protein